MLILGIRLNEVSCKHVLHYLALYGIRPELQLVELLQFRDTSSDLIMCTILTNHVYHSLHVNTTKQCMLSI